MRYIEYEYIYTYHGINDGDMILGLCDNYIYLDNEQQIISITIIILINNDGTFYTFTSFAVLKLLFIHTIIPACFV